jgi:hypothetical protein
LGRSDVDEERSFTGASSFLGDRNVLTQATHSKWRPNSPYSRHIQSH